MFLIGKQNIIYVKIHPRIILNGVNVKKPAGQVIKMLIRFCIKSVNSGFFVVVASQKLFIPMYILSEQNEIEFKEIGLHLHEMVFF